MKRVCHIVGTFALLTLVAGPIAAQETAIKEGAEKTKDAVVTGTKVVVDKTKEAGFRPHGVEGQKDGEWVLIDLSEMIVHVMLPRVREFYGLEKLWDMTATKRAARA